MGEKQMPRIAKEDLDHYRAMTDKALRSLRSRTSRSIRELSESLVAMNIVLGERVTDEAGAQDDA